MNQFDSAGRTLEATPVNVAGPVGAWTLSNVSRCCKFCLGVRLTCPSEICEAGAEPAARVEVIVTQLQLVMSVMLPCGLASADTEGVVGVDVLGVTTDGLGAGGELGTMDVLNVGVSEGVEVTTSVDVTTEVVAIGSAGVGEASICIVLVGGLSLHQFRNWVRDGSSGGTELGNSGLLFVMQAAQRV